MVGENLFHGIDPEHHEYRRRAHLAEMISLLGPPLPGPLSQGELWSKFFSEDGNSNLSTFPNSSCSSISLTCVYQENSMVASKHRLVFIWNNW